MESVGLSHIHNYYKGKRVFITGHTGFKGTWLYTCLQMAGAVVRGYSLAPLYQGLFQQLLDKNFASNDYFDIRDAKELDIQIKEFQPDFIFHMAAQPLVRLSYEKPIETFEVNAVGTANVLNTLRSLKNKCNVIIITTDKVYKNKETGIYYNENDELGGHDPYSASKACAELITNSFRDSFFKLHEYSDHKKNIVTVRAGNVIGGGDFSLDRIIPDIIRFLKSGQSIQVRNPKSIRPWQHVLEPLHGYLILGVRMDLGGDGFSNSYNFGPMPEDHMEVKDLVDFAIKSWGSGSWVNVSNDDSKPEAKLLKLDINLAKNDLNWSPKLSAKEAIQWTIEWYKKPVEQQYEFTIEQIQKYFNL